MIAAIIPIIVLLTMVIVLSIILLILREKFPNDQNTILTEINKLLPQTQCGQCEYPGCMPYATAIFNNTADINKCPPGGQQTIDKLAELLNLPSGKTLDSTLKPSQKISLKAYIDESKCIGCLLCIKACPVDAIVGADQQMHTVITDQCTGCELCVAPCPMDCITMQKEILKPRYASIVDPEINYYA